MPLGAPPFAVAANQHFRNAGLVLFVKAAKTDEIIIQSVALTNWAQPPSFEQPIRSPYAARNVNGAGAELVRYSQVLQLPSYPPSCGQTPL